MPTHGQEQDIVLNFKPQPCKKALQLGDERACLKSTGRLKKKIYVSECVDEHLVIETQRRRRPRLSMCTPQATAEKQRSRLHGGTLPAYCYNRRILFAKAPHAAMLRRI